MMKIVAAALVFLPAACASTATTRGPSTPDESRAGIELVLVDSDATQPSFPARLTEARTPAAADRLAHRVRAELGGEARADLRLCVAGDGSVASASITDSSGIEALDEVFVDTARNWRYEPLAAAGETACQKVEISYVVKK